MLASLGIGRAATGALAGGYLSLTCVFIAAQLDLGSSFSRPSSLCMGNIATEQLTQGSSFTQDNSMAQFSLTLHPERAANRRIRVKPNHTLVITLSSSEITQIPVQLQLYFVATVKINSCQHRVCRYLSSWEIRCLKVVEVVSMATSCLPQSLRSEISQQQHFLYLKGKTRKSPWKKVTHFSFMSLL